MQAIIREARPRQWVKNSLVVAAPGAAGVLDDGGRAAATLVVFLAFCMVSSGTYYWNDILDVEADRRHPTKRNRPIAAGTIPIEAARLIGTALLAGRAGARARTGRWQTSAVLAAYVVTTLAYSKVFKHVPVIDLVLVASGFVPAGHRWRGGRRRPDVGMVRVGDGVRFAVHRDRQAFANSAKWVPDRLGPPSTSTRSTICARCCR
ncbi:MAG: UbiA family prenyltransferase [Ilumatobacteraceae bacterium]